MGWFSKGGSGFDFDLLELGPGREKGARGGLLPASIWGNTVVLCCAALMNRCMGLPNSELAHREIPAVCSTNFFFFFGSEKEKSRERDRGGHEPVTSTLADSNKEMSVRLMEKRREIQSSYRGLTRLKIIQTIARYPPKSTRDQYSCY